MKVYYLLSICVFGFVKGEKECRPFEKTDLDLISHAPVSLTVFDDRVVYSPADQNKIYHVDLGSLPQDKKAEMTTLGALNAYPVKHVNLVTKDILQAVGQKSATDFTAVVSKWKPSNNKFDERANLDKLAGTDFYGMSGREEGKLAYFAIKKSNKVEVHESKDGAKSTKVKEVSAGEGSRIVSMDVPEKKDQNIVIMTDKAALIGIKTAAAFPNLTPKTAAMVSGPVVTSSAGTFAVDSSGIKKIKTDFSGTDTVDEDAGIKSATHMFAKDDLIIAVKTGATSKIRISTEKGDKEKWSNLSVKDVTKITAAAFDPKKGKLYVVGKEGTKYHLYSSDCSNDKTTPTDKPTAKPQKTTENPQKTTEKVTTTSTATGTSTSGAYANVVSSSIVAAAVLVSLLI